MSKLALLVGINHYKHEAFPNLNLCESDAESMGSLLKHHWAESGKGPPNYDTRVYTSAGNRAITTDFLRDQVALMMRQAMGDGDVLFYFSGHGQVTGQGGFLVTQDATPEQPGYPMQELLAEANRSGNTSVIIILDCCYGGAIGNAALGEGAGAAAIGPNVTILAGSGAEQASSEGFENSLFTELLLEALQGGAADPRGEVHAAGVYAYLDHALGPWDQRPVYKSYARRLKAIRNTQPTVFDADLSRLPEWFPTAESEFAIDPSFEPEHESADAANMAVFDSLKRLRNASLLKHSGRDLYWTAMESGTVSLTLQGRLFWRRAKRDEFWR